MVILVKNIVMKKGRIFVLIFTLICISFAFKSLDSVKFSTNIESHYPNGVNIPGYTGAPGEYNCGDCHNCDATQAGKISRFLIKDSLGQLITNYSPNCTYTIEFTDTILGNKGFQCTVLNDSNVREGDLKVGSNTQISTLLNAKTKQIRQYINHTDPFSTTWTFQWKAPSTTLGRVTFYFSTGNYQNIYLSNYSIQASKKYTVSGGSLSEINENMDVFKFICFYSDKENSLFLRFNAPEPGNSYVNFVDESGKTVYNTKLGYVNLDNENYELKLPEKIISGYYSVQLFVNNYFVIKKIYIP